MHIYIHVTRIFEISKDTLLTLFLCDIATDLECGYALTDKRISYFLVCCIYSYHSQLLSDIGAITSFPGSWKLYLEPCVITKTILNGIRAHDSCNALYKHNIPLSLTLFSFSTSALFSTYYSTLILHRRILNTFYYLLCGYLSLRGDHKSLPYHLNLQDIESLLF